MSASLKRMSDMGAKNGEGMLEVLADDMGRYGLLTVAFGLGPIGETGASWSKNCIFPNSYFNIDLLLLVWHFTLGMIIFLSNWIYF